MPNFSLKLSAIAFLAGFSIAPLSRANDIEPGKEFYDATRAVNPVVIDGNLTEWVGVPVLADPKFFTPKGSGTNGTLVLFEEYQGGTWTGPDDQTSAVQVVYDVDNVYFGFVVTDDYHENAANSPWNGDSVQLMISNADRNLDVARYNYSLGGVEGALGDVIVEHEAGPALAEDCNCATEAVVTRDSVAKKTFYEIRLPVKALGLTNLQAGVKFGLGMAINDGDELTPGQKGWGGLGAHSIVHGKTPSETALVTLTTNTPGTDRLFFSAINPTIDSFSFRATDKGTSIVDPASAKLLIDGQTVTLTPVKSGDATDFSYSASAPYPANSDHTFQIEVKDSLGNTVTDEGSFRTPAYALLTAADKVTGDATKPGFLWRVHQNSNLIATDNIRPLQQLAGLLGENFADPNAQSVAEALGRPGANNTLPIEFDIPTTINFDQAGGSTGDIIPDDPMPGIPGTSGDGMNGIAAEIITYLELPAGRHTLIVNSDEGFRTTAGNINDLFRAQVAGEFNAARTVNDSAYTVFAAEAGVYPFRTIWFEGIGEANIEWKLQMPDLTEVLLNDTVNGGFKAYRATTTPSPTGISLVSPLPNAASASFDSAVFASIVEGTDAVDLASVKLSLDSAAVSATPAKSGNVITISHQPAATFVSGSQHSASITYTAGGTARTENWSFTVEAYPTLTTAEQAISVDRTKPGFTWRVFQNEAVIPNSMAQAELALAGQLTANGQVLPNLADPSVVGLALDVGTQDGPLVKFEIPGTINLSQTEGEFNGNFTPDDQMPGIPGLNGLNDGIDAEIVTFAELPAGVITMGVNSDDGFRTQSGDISIPANAVFLGEFDGPTGRGASDTLFRIVVRDAGVYPLRTIYQDGGGGGNVEWFTVKADGTKVLLNDTTNGGVPAFRVGVAPTGPAQFGPTLRISGGQIEITWTEPGVVLQETTDLKSWTDLTTATSPHQVSPGTRAAVFYRLKK